MKAPIDTPFTRLQKKLAEKGIVEVPTLVPPERRDNEMLSDFQEVQNITLAAIAEDSNLLPFINDTFGVPLKADLEAIEKLLKGSISVEGAFFDVSEGNTACTAPAANSFTTASGKTLRENPKEANNNNKECNVEEYIIDRIKGEIVESVSGISWSDIIGLDDVKKTINEIVLWPISRPDIFTGLRKPPKGLLLFGPPGTGKTMIGKCIASQCKATFFSISASSLTSKWVGEGEKMVRALFYLARKMAPSVVFVDEIDSLLSQRTESEHEGSRRIKTEFLVQFDGASVVDDRHILIIGATNRPQEIDEAARRRLVKRIYVPLPDSASRKAMITSLISGYRNSIGEEELDSISELIKGYSGSDIFNLCREATLEPLREIEDIKRFKPEDARPITIDDFRVAVAQIRKSVSEKDLAGYSSWNESFGSIPRHH